MLKLRLAFMGTPDFAVVPLRALAQAGHDIAAVYTQPPKPAGRGQQVKKSPAHEAAEQMGLTVRTPQSLRDEAEQSFIAGLNLDAIVVVAYGLILPQAVLDAPRLGCLNIHFSLLPRWRGAAPVPRAILAGDRETGVSIMQMAAGLDTGDILMCEKRPIAPDATSPKLLAELSERGAGMTLRVLEELAAGTLKPTPQPKDGVTYAAKLTREDGRIDWTKPAAEIERQIRALQPWPGGFFMLGKEPVKVLAAEVVSDASPSPLGGKGWDGGSSSAENPPPKSSPQGGRTFAPGTLLDDQFTVACGQGALRLLQVQRGGKNPTDGASLLRGLRLPVGSKL